MTAETVKGFKEFSFWKNEEFKKHIDSFEFRPVLEQVPRLQKKWYKKHIDENFDIDADLTPFNFTPETETAPQTNGQTQSESNPSTNTTAQQTDGPRTRDMSGNKRYKAEGFLKLIFLVLTFMSVPFPYGKIVTLAMGVTICMLGMTRQVGDLTYSKDYFLKCLSNDFGISVFYIIIIISIPSLTTFLWLPIN